MAAWVRRKDAKNEFKVLAYQEAPSPPMTPQLREACRRALYVIKKNGEILSHGRATLFILETLDVGYGLPRLLSARPFIWFVEIGYRIVARNRPFFAKFLFTKKQMGEEE